MNIKWDAKNYQEGFSFVPAYGEDVLNLLTAPKGSRVIDLGCGNGKLTQRLKARGFDVTGIDASEEMLALARENVPDIVFKKADAEDFHLAEPADAVFSNAVLHWIDAGKQEKVLKNVSSNLKAGGEFVFEFGGYGCGESVHSTLEQVFRKYGRTYLRTFYFPTIGEYAPLVEKAGMRVEYAVLFDRPTPQKDGRTVQDWIRMFDMKPFEGIPQKETQDILDEAEIRLKDRLFVNGIWYIDYVRIRMRARKV